MNEQRLAVRQLSELTGRSERHVRRYAKAAKIGKHPVVVRTETGSTGEQYEFLLDSLPEELQAKWYMLHTPNVRPAEVEVHRELISAAKRKAKVKGGKVAVEVVEAAEQRWLAASDPQRGRAKDKLDALSLVESMVRGGIKVDAAVRAVAGQIGKSPESIYQWKKRAKGWPSDKKIFALLDGYGGGAQRKDIHPEIWEKFCEDYLREESPDLQSCYEWVNEYAVLAGIQDPIPSVKTFQRRVEEIPEPLKVLARQGQEAVKRLYPAQERDKSMLHALECVNADGHKWDVMVRWPDGEVGRPILTGWQDVYSGRILSYRNCKTENSDSVRLSFGDMMMTYGIPDHAYLDNGRGFASKWLTGGMKTRFRFKVKEDEPHGIFTMLGVEVHWATPYHGQAKPIERCFRDFAKKISKHPAFAGAYTGNKPDAKPANYGKRAVPFDVFEAVVAEAIAAHNARAGRRSKVCAGRSFDEVFHESYAQADAAGQIRHANEIQKMFCLMTAEQVMASRTEGGTITLMDNRYWSEELCDYRGQKLTVRFDPDNLYEAVWVSTRTGEHICHAPCVMAAGFKDTQAAREHNRARNQFIRDQRDMLKALKKMDILESAIPDMSHVEMRDMDAESKRAANALKERMKQEPAPKKQPNKANSGGATEFARSLGERVRETVPVKASISDLMRRLQGDSNE